MTLNAEQDLREKVIGMIFTFLLHFRFINYFVHWRCLDKGKLFNCSSSNSIPGLIGDFTNNFMKCYNSIFVCFKFPWTNTTRFTWTRIGNFHQKLLPPESGQCISVMTEQTHIYTNGKVKSFETLVTPKRKFINNKFGASRSEFQLQETFFRLT